MNALVELGGDDSHHFLASLAGPDKSFPVRADAVVALAALDVKEAAHAPPSFCMNQYPAIQRRFFPHSSIEKTPPTHWPTR